MLGRQPRSAGDLLQYDVGHHIDHPDHNVTDRPQPPEFPALAKENSQAGAKAFIRYYADLINYSWAAGDTDSLRSVASKECKGCLAAADGIDEVIADGGYRRGADWSPRGFFVVPLQPATEPIVNVAIHVSQREIPRVKHEHAA